MRKEISTENAPAAIGPYSQAVEKGGMLFCSGQIPIDPATGKLINDDISRATDQSLKNLIAVVKAANYRVEDIVKVNVYVRSMEDFSAVNDVYKEYFSATKPARALVEVSNLPKNALIEIEAVAIR
ncbi:MAG: RidA family protein [Fidelibacterota bacterium]